MLEYKKWYICMYILLCWKSLASRNSQIFVDNGNASHTDVAGITLVVTWVNKGDASHNSVSGTPRVSGIAFIYTHIYIYIYIYCSSCVDIKLNIFAVLLYLYLNVICFPYCLVLAATRCEDEDSDQGKWRFFNDCENAPLPAWGRDAPVAKIDMELCKRDAGDTGFLVFILFARVLFIIIFYIKLIKQQMFSHTHTNSIYDCLPFLHEQQQKNK